MMQDYYTSKGKHLKESERQLIECWKNRDKLFNREIAYRLGKSPQTINNEIKRGTIQLKMKHKYSSNLAQANYTQHRGRSKRPTKLTVELDHKISQAVKEKVSLEVVHQELKNSVCLRTLYNWIASGLLSVSYHELLYPQYRKVKKQRVTKPKHTLGLSIEERPEIINARSE